MHWYLPTWSFKSGKPMLKLWTYVPPSSSKNHNTFLLSHIKCKSATPSLSSLSWGTSLKNQQPCLIHLCHGTVCGTPYTQYLKRHPKAGSHTRNIKGTTVCHCGPSLLIDNQSWFPGLAASSNSNRLCKNKHSLPLWAWPLDLQGLQILRNLKHWGTFQHSGSCTHRFD